MSVNNLLKKSVIECKKQLIGCILIVFTNSVYGQDKIAGSVVTQTVEASIPAEFSTVMLYKAIDSTFVISTLSDETGKFEFLNPIEGNYFIRIDNEGILPFSSEMFTYVSGELQVGEMKLTQKVSEIQEVSVIVKKPILTVTAEKTILNVANITNMTGVNALEVLRRTPGVMIDKDNTISLKGKVGVRIFIDGRPSQMANEDLVNLLIGMMASDIESIEVIANPSAKYDASGTGGVINIVLKKNKGFGNNAGIELGTTYSKTGKFNSSLSFNHRDKRFTVFANYTITGGQWADYMTLYRIQEGYIYDQKTANLRKGINQNFKLGTDYSINTKHTVGCNITGNTRNGEYTNQSRTPISLQSTNEVEQVLVALNEGPHTMLNLNFNANYRYADTMGTKFSTDADYGYFSKQQSSHQPNSYMNADETQLNESHIYRNSTPTDIQIITLKSDYERKLKKTQLSLGYKLSEVETNNIFDFYNEINGEITKDLTKSNTFHYSEKVYASYVNINRKFNKLSVQAGLRYEYTHSIGRLESAVSNPVPVDRMYGNLFPSTAFSYDLNDKNTLSLTYSRRIDRPNYQDLNPFENKLDELTYQKGNAFLKPQFSHTLEFSHVFMQFLVTSLGYTRTNDFMTEIIDTLNGSASFITQTNINYVNTYNFTISAPIPVQKWLMSFINFSLYRNDYHANFTDGKTINLGNTAYNVYISNSFTLPKGWSIELSGWYNSPSIMVTSFLGRRMYSVDAGFKKKILKGNGDLKLNFSDIFRSQIWAGTSNYLDFYMYVSGGYESRQIRLNFSYRFGNTSIKGENHKTGSEEEKSRIKTK